MILGEVIKSVRLSMGITQLELCKRAMITQGFYSSIESGNNIPSIEMLKRITDALNIPLFWVICQATQKQDIPRNKRNVYTKTRPALDSILDEIINSK